MTLQPDSRFPCQQQLNGFWFNSDPGWQQHSQSFYKGYQDNFCQVNLTADQAWLAHNEFRTFPLWYEPGCITNLPRGELQQAWANIDVSMDPTGQITINKKALNFTVPTGSLTRDQAVDQIKAILDRSAQEFKALSPQNLKFYSSGGCDTMLLYVLARAHDLDFELLTDSHYEPDSFTRANQHILDQFWAYKQIHHWTNPTWLATGSCGDEYFLRGPAVISLITAWYDIDFEQALKANPDAYHFHYFNKYHDLWAQGWRDRQATRQALPIRAALNHKILNNLANDHQHWHLGTTLTWTPFHNLDIVKILLRCEITDLMSQFLDGALSKQLIARYDPRAVDYISTYKNVNSQENIKKLLENQ